MPTTRPAVVAPGPDAPAPPRGTTLTLRGDRAVDLMTRPPVRLAEHASIRDAAAILTDRKIGALAVVDDQGRPVGVVSRTDLVRFLRDLPARPEFDRGARPEPGQAAPGGVIRGEFRESERRGGHETDRRKAPPKPGPEKGPESAAESAAPPPGAGPSPEARAVKGDEPGCTCRPKWPAGPPSEDIDRVHVRDLMTPLFICVNPDTPAAEVVRRMTGCHVHQLFVVDAGGALVGVISTTDVVRNVRM